MKSYYRINVSLNGNHFFATSDTITTESHARRVYEEIYKKFPSSEGFRVDVVHWRASGYKVMWDIDMRQESEEFYEKLMDAPGIITLS